MLKLLLDLWRNGGKMNFKEKEELCKPFAEFLARNDLTFAEVRRNKAVTDRIALLVEQEMGLTREKLDELLMFISMMLGIRERLWKGEAPPSEYASKYFGRAKYLPTLDEQEQRPDSTGRTHAQYGKWPAR